MDLRQLEILQAIADTGSFTACGRKLHVSQSAISRQIALLEEELGEPLFLRVGRHVRMTPAEIVPQIAVFDPDEPLRAVPLRLARELRRKPRHHPRLERAPLAVRSKPLRAPMVEKCAPVYMAFMKPPPTLE